MLENIMMYDQFAAIMGVIAGIISLAGFVPYILSIFRGETVPNCATWWIWTLNGTIIGSAYFFATSDLGAIWVPLSYILGPLFISILAIKYNDKEYLSRLDMVCLISAFISLILWGLSQSPLLALFFLLVIDILGAIPTYIKSYYDPLSENLVAWLIFSLGNILNLFSVTHWDLGSATYPIYLALMASTITYTVIIGRRRIKHN